MNIDDSEYEGDEEMLRIVRRLLSAASDSNLRQDMNVEDEYFSAIETRDTAIMNRDRIIKEKEDTIKEKEDTIKEKEDTIKKKDKTIKSLDEALSSAIKMLAEAGMSPEQIAISLGKTIEEIKTLI